MFLLSSCGSHFFFNENMQTKVLPAKFIMKTDDDAFVRIDEVLSSLKTKPSNGLLYGLISFESSPHREKDSKWFISDEVSTPYYFILLDDTSLSCTLSLRSPILCRNGPILHTHHGHMVRGMSSLETSPSSLFKGITKETSR